MPQIPDLQDKPIAAANDRLVIRDTTTNTDKDTPVSGLATAVAASLPAGSVGVAALSSNVRKSNAAFHNNLVIPTAQTKYQEISLTAPKAAVNFTVTVRDANSGGARTGQIFLFKDGVKVSGTDQFIWQTTVNAQFSSYAAGSMNFTESDGNSHTYALFVASDAANTTFLTNTSLEVAAVA